MHLAEIKFPNSYQAISAEVVACVNIKEDRTKSIIAHEGFRVPGGKTIKPWRSPLKLTAVVVGNNNIGCLYGKEITLVGAPILLMLQLVILMNIVMVDIAEINKDYLWICKGSLKASTCPKWKVLIVWSALMRR